ncbi:hypothetical protein [Mycoplasma sp. ATU-Cv-508]
MSTTPWTLPANSALAVGAKIIYSLVQVDQQSFLLAKDCLEKWPS